jgi:hypothetical protein
MNQIRKRLTYANVMSSVAVFLVLGGAAFAAIKLPKNSVGTKQLKKNAVTTAKIKNGAVTGAKIKLSSLGTVPSATNASHATTADKATTADNATNATLLGGTPASGFQSKILTAVVTNNGTTAAVVRGTSGTSAQTVATGDVFVKFPQDVSGCTWIATVGNPGSTTAPPDFTSVRGNSSQGPNVVQVLTWDTSGSEVAANFHLAAIC